MFQMIFTSFIVLLVSCLFPSQVYANRASWWEIQSIDTMKHSRDMAKQMLEDLKKYENPIDIQIKDIADTGATHVSIATPYDEEFIPVLKLWVQTARRYGLHVWFRGNFAGWEQWFAYKKISREDHLRLTKELIRTHPELFAEGDIFSPCPECENGGPGDPRIVGGVEQYRAFLIDLYTTSREAFHSIGVNVQTNIHSMNGDVARLVMDTATTQALGGIVTIDHYVGTPEELAMDVRDFARISGGKIVLGEFGAPIPDIHGKMSETEQAKWIDDSLSQLSLISELIGINYWVNIGGSTALWNDGGTARKAVSILSKYYTPKSTGGTIVDELDRPLSGVRVKSDLKTVISDAHGQFHIPYFGDGVWLQVEADSYKNYSIQATKDSVQPLHIALEHEEISLLLWVLIWLHRAIPSIF